MNNRPPRTTHRFQISTRLAYQLAQDGWLLLNVAATRGATQRVVSENISNSLGAAFREHAVPDDASRFHGLPVPAGGVEIVYKAVVERDITDYANTEVDAESPLIELPPDVVRFLYPSRYCESDKLARLAAKAFGDFNPGHERVAGICNWLYHQIDYQPGMTDAHTSAVECLTLRGGVCRDFAHLGITFCRAMGIPARYGSAYAFQLAQPDFHAFFEVWLEGKWWCYDATRLAPQQGFVRVGVGHDAADTSVATMSASALLLNMEITVEKLSPGFVPYADTPVGF